MVVKQECVIYSSKAFVPLGGGKESVSREEYSPVIPMVHLSASSRIA